MLDSLFGFGKSKKNKHSNGSSQNDDSSPNDDNSYVFVGNNDPNRPPYPQTIMLNDELIKMGSSSSVVQPGSNSMYPNLDPSKYNVPNPSLPYSTVGGGAGSSLKTPSASCRTCSPIDNVPFSITTNGTGGNGGSNVDPDEVEILNTLNRVENFMESSKYDFNLEKSILRDSI